MTTLALILALHISLNDRRMEGFLRPVFHFILGYEGKGTKFFIRLVMLIAVPLWVGFRVLSALQPGAVAPVSFRTVHPSPPPEFSGLENPLRKDKESMEANIEEGARIYFKNCVFCHGDLLEGDGIFAGGFFPPPANLADIGTIAQLQESYVFWRISTGGPGLPDKSKPWDSAMPVWQDMLSEEEIWKVILYIYDATEHTPLTWEQNYETGKRF